MKAEDGGYSQFSDGKRAREKSRSINTTGTNSKKAGGGGSGGSTSGSQRSTAAAASSIIRRTPLSIRAVSLVDVVHLWVFVGFLEK